MSSEYIGTCIFPQDSSTKKSEQYQFVLKVITNLLTSRLWKIRGLSCSLSDPTLKDRFSTAGN